MAVTQYIGARYVPLFADPAEWSSEKAYEPLTIVLHDGNSYTSKQSVPVGIDINDTDFWAETGNYNAQVEQYRRETSQALDAATTAQNDVDTLLPKAEFSAENTVKDCIDNLMQHDNMYGFEYVTHETEGPEDTGWFLLKMPRSLLSISHHNNSGSDIDPKNRTSNAFKYAQLHQNAFIVTNCDYGTNDYPIRLNGITLPGEDLTRPYLAFDAAGNPTWFPIGTNLQTLPAEYETAFACDSYLVRNGSLYVDSYIENYHQYQPWNCFGWDDDYWYILNVEGRGNLQRGLLLKELGQLAFSLGIRNAVNLDGGGSVVVAINNGDETQKVNYSRDHALPFNTLRFTKTAQVYTLTNDIDRHCLDGFVSLYKSYNHGHNGFSMSARHLSTQTVNLADAESWPVVFPITNISEQDIDKYYFYNLPETFETARIPIPERYYAEKVIHASGLVCLSVSGSAVTTAGDLRLIGRLVRNYEDVDTSLASSYETLHLNIDTGVQRFIVPFDFWFSLSQSTAPDAVRSQLFVQVELNKVSPLAVSIINYSYGVFNVSFDGEL